MTLNLNLSDLSLAEKLELMEALWEDLSSVPEAVQSPTWHASELEDRIRRVAEGRSRFVDWDAAKSELKRAVE